MIDLTVPELGLDNAQEILVSCWLVGCGDELIEGDRVVELLAGDITFDVSSPVTGRLVHIAVEPDDKVRPGDCLGTIDPEEVDE
jgi:pyruvate/2-oxoglutarate dehydrogenase complex dihydrolipoamide acyltransferase (E2) component